MTETTSEPVIGEKEGKKNASKPGSRWQKILGQPWHVLAFVTYPIVFLAFRNHVKFFDCGLKPLFWTCLGASVALGGLGLLQRSIRKAAMIVSLLGMSFFLYGLTQIQEDEFVESELYYLSQSCSAFYRSNFFTWPVLLFVVLAIVILRKVRKEPIVKATLFLNVWALLLLCNGVFGLTRSEIAIYRAEQELKAMMSFGDVETFAPQSPARERDESCPDIYFILPDALTGYASSAKGPNDIIDFIESLERKGFQVPRKSTSNYSFTILSLPSMLNMEYVHDTFPKWFSIGKELVEDPGAIPAKRDGLKMFVDQKTATQRFLMKKGYVLNPEKSWWDTKNAFEFLKDDREAGYKNHPFKIPGESEDNPRHMWFKRVLAQIHRTKRVASEHSRNPRFLFCYIHAPHAPSVFKEDGSYCPEFPYVGRSVQFSNAYFAQRKYIVGQIEEIVDHILLNSDHDPVIVIASDHGQRANVANLYDTKTKIAELNKKSYRLSGYNNFIAVYLPEKYRREIPEDLTNVNVFRYVFNCLFQADFPLLPNRQFGGSTSHSVLTESTEKVSKYFRDFDAALEELEAMSAQEPRSDQTLR